MKIKSIMAVTLTGIFLTTCEMDDDNMPRPVDPDSAEEVEVDRFSSSFANLFVRNAENGFPGPNQPVDFDAIPAFNTHGLGPNGEMTHYYNFDVLSTTPAPIFVLFREGESNPVEGQLNIIDVIPGDAGYNDFWLVNMVSVPANYTANTITSLEEITGHGYTITATNTIVNCPVVPKGSMARLRFRPTESSELTRGWYKNKVVYYFNFLEKELLAVNGKVPTSDIYVTFNINPDMEGGGPASGFKTEDGTATGQTHNVPVTLPDDASYSPLWDVIIYDNTEFENVSDLQSANMAAIIAENAAIVNCPIVDVN